MTKDAQRAHRVAAILRGCTGRPHHQDENWFTDTYKRYCFGITETRFSCSTTVCRFCGFGGKVRRYCEVHWAHQCDDESRIK